jgi:pilus assembly protein CpaB
MRRKSILPLIFALLCGLVVSVGVGHALKQKPEAPPTEMEEILVAKEAIDYGTPVTEELVKLEKWPKHLVPPGTVKKMEDIKDLRAKDLILPGDPLREEKLLSEEEFASASLQIPKGYRVVSVKVNASTTGGNLIQVGDRVDVMVYLKTSLDGQPMNETRTILQDIRVFAVNRQYNRKVAADAEAGSTEAKTVSILVTPPQAEVVALAEELGNIRLSIRSPEDDLEGGADGANLEELFGVREKSDRDEEVAAASDQSDRGGFLDWLQTQTENVVSNEESVAATGAEDNSWTMILVRGTEMEQVRFDESSLVPTVVPVGPGASGMALDPASVLPEDLSQPEGGLELNQDGLHQDALPRD